MTPSPFELAQNIGNRFGNVVERQSDIGKLSAMDEILTQASQSNDPAAANKMIGQLLASVSPERQPAAMKIVEQRMAQIKQKQTEDADEGFGLPRNFSQGSKEGQKYYTENKSSGDPVYSKGLNFILSGNESGLKAIFEDPNISGKTKDKLFDRRSSHETRKSVQDREIRNRQNTVQNSYRKQIESKSRILKDARSKDKIILQEEIKELERLEKLDLQSLARNPKSYNNLHIWGNADPEFLPEEIDEAAEEIIASENTQEKIRFDSNNPEHTRRRDEILAQVNGDRAEANKILAEEFTI